MNVEQRKTKMLGLLESAASAVDPEELTRTALTGKDTPALIVAIGKAGAAMCRGAVAALGEGHGVCVTNVEGQVPPGIELILGDHPVPGTRSFQAGEQVLRLVARAEGRITALISGGGSALCEQPIDGVDPGFVTEVNRALLTAGIPIREVNLVRRHLSKIKNGGLLSHATAPIDSYLISDVGGGDIAEVASGPTIHRPHDPEAAISVMLRAGIDVPERAHRALHRASIGPSPRGEVSVLADGHTAVSALAEKAASSRLHPHMVDGWIDGNVEDALDAFLDDSGSGITVAAGEPDVVVTGRGVGGRNTHAALLAARRLAGTDAVFAAFATDGVDGTSSAAGAIVDGQTIDRGGDPEAALDRSDSATYLEKTGDLIVTGPTGTNVSDLWVLWR